MNTFCMRRHVLKSIRAYLKVFKNGSCIFYFAMKDKNKKKKKKDEEEEEEQKKKKEEGK